VALVTDLAANKLPVSLRRLTPAGEHPDGPTPGLSGGQGVYGTAVIGDRLWGCRCSREPGIRAEWLRRNSFRKPRAQVEARPDVRTRRTPMVQAELRDSLTRAVARA
jgi:hypothetical protein